VQLAVSFPELDLRADGLALSLLLGADADVNGYGHQVPSFASTT
jgi:hypothetical protein